MTDTNPLDGAGLITQERARQITENGYTPEYDDKHGYGDMALVASLYAAPVQIYRKHDHPAGPRFDKESPWADSDKRPRRGDVLMDPREHTVEQRLDLLVKAGALIAAEIDRIKRLDTSAEIGGE